MAKKIALVGTAQSGSNAPFNDSEWEIWGVGNRASYVTRATRWFELHRLDGEPGAWAAEWRRLMRTWSDECEIWMFYPEPDLGPNIIAFDPKPLIGKYGGFFMTSSFSWMMAQAIEEGATEIGLWGVDMEYGTEYREQRTGLRHFIDVARLNGISVRRVASSGIAYEPIPYPLWQDDPLLSKVDLRRKVFDEKRCEVHLTLERMTVDLQRNEGALMALRDLRDASDSDHQLDRRIDAVERKIESLRIGIVPIRDDLKKLEGVLDELSWLKDYLQP